MNGNPIIQVVTLMGIFGIPSIFAIVSWCVKQVIGIKKRNKEVAEKMEANLKLLMEAYQIQLREILLAKYHKFQEANRITDKEQKDWMKIYDIYEHLAENGPMESKKEWVEHFATVPDEE